MLSVFGVLSIGGIAHAQYVTPISFSQTNLTLSIGQSANVSIYGSGSYYVNSNINSSVATPTINGSNVTVYGSSAGTTTLNICSSYSFNSCANLYVTVNNYFGSSAVSFSQNNLSVGVGQAQAVIVYGNGNYYVSNYSNPSVASASISGSTLTVTGSSVGTSTLTVCSTSGSSCADLYVTVSGSSSGHSQSYWTVDVGQSQMVTITGAGDYTVSNTNSSVVDAYMTNGNTLNLYGISTGTANVTVCSQVNNSCTTLVVTVPYYNNYYNGNYYNNYSSPVTLGQYSVYLSAGQSTSIDVYGGSWNWYGYNNGNNYGYNSYNTYNSGTRYSVSTSNSSVATAYVGSNTVNVTAGYTGGTASITVCPIYGSGSCATLTVTVWNPIPIRHQHPTPIHPGYPRVY